jgi:hypothetical protein
MLNPMKSPLGKNKLTAHIANRIYRLFQHDITSSRIRIGQQTLLASKGLRSNFTKLSDAEVTVFSQWGEDGILDYLCDIAGLDRPNILELGAGNFEECNSRFLIENRFANSVLVDARLDLKTVVEQNSAYWKTHMLAINSWITPETIKEIQSQAKAFLGIIDIVSIDIDGNDYWVLAAFDLSEVAIVVAEYNPLFGSHLPVTIPRNDDFDRTEAHFSNLYYGVGLSAWVKFFKEKGFVLAGTNKVGSNAFFIKEALLQKLHFVPSSDLRTYINWGVRESRTKEGKLNFLSGEKRISAISDLELCNVETGEMLKISNLN